MFIILLQKNIIKHVFFAAFVSDLVRHEMNVGDLRGKFREALLKWKAYVPRKKTARLAKWFQNYMWEREKKEGQKEDV